MTRRFARFLSCCAALVLLSGQSLASDDAAEEEWTPDLSEPVTSSTKNNSPSASSSSGEQSRFSLHYFGIFFGPVLQQGNTRPTLDTRNFVTLNSTVAKDTSIGITGGWSWQGIPSDTAILRDPFVKISKANIVQFGSFSWYGDFRVHLPVTAESRANDLWVGMQSFHFFGWEPGPAGAGFAFSARYNQFGGEGQGDDWELYAAPSVFWNVLPELAFNLLLEWGAGRPFGENSNLLLSNGLDIEPGLNWRISEMVLLNPYVTIPLDQTSLDLSGGTSVGMTVSWQLF
jgi:hypothetical protein